MTGDQRRPNHIRRHSMSPTTDVAVVANDAVEVYSPALLARCREQDPQEVLKRFAARFEAAQGLDDLFGALEGTNSQKLIGCRLEIASVAWAPYQSDRGMIPLAIVQAADLDSGEVIEFATTSGMLCMFLYKAEVLELMPFQARIEGKKTNSGQTALNFARV